MDHISKPEYHQTGIPINEQNAYKTTDIIVNKPEDIKKIRRVCKIARDILDIAGDYLNQKGITGNDINDLVYKKCIEYGVYPSPLNYYHFPASVCISPNEVICHGIPNSNKITSGSIVNIDVSIYLDGVHADLNETFLIEFPGHESCDEKKKIITRTAYMCLEAIIPMIKPGTFYRDLGNVISKIATKNRCSVAKNWSGHGIGIHFHQNPRIPHYANNKAIGVMKPGHIFTVEPMINFGLNNSDDKILSDNWTVVTKNNEPSAQFEHTFLVTETGCEILTARKGEPKDRLLEYDEQKFTRTGL
jgi:methionyl aminopeptidase